MIWGSDWFRPSSTVAAWAGLALADPDQRADAGFPRLGGDIVVAPQPFPITSDQMIQMVEM